MRLCHIYLQTSLCAYVIYICKLVYAPMSYIYLQTSLCAYVIYICKLVYAPMPYIFAKSMVPEF